MKQLILSFLCLLLGSVLVCASYAISTETVEAEEEFTATKTSVQETILATQHASEAYTPILPLPEETDAPEEAWTTVTATAYCPCEICCGKWALNRPDGIVYTASGAIAEEGVTIAADWSVYPPGTILCIEGIGERTVQDRGGAINGQKIDVYFDSHEDALRFGCQEVQIKVISETER